MVVLAQTNPNTLISVKAPSVRSGDLAGLTARRRRVRDVDARRIEDMYAKGLSTRSIAKQLGFGRTTVLNVLKRRGVKLKPQGRSPDM